MHDQKGRPLQAGDIVLIPARITSVSATEDYCNVAAMSIFGRRPDGMAETFGAINTGVMLRANEGDENDLEGLARLASAARA